MLRYLFFLDLKITLPTQSFQTSEEHCCVMVNAPLVALQGLNSATTVYLNSHKEIVISSPEECQNSKI